MTTLLNKRPAFVALLLAIGLQGCMTASVTTSGTNSAREFLDERWAPKTREALREFSMYAHETMGTNASVPRFVLVTNSKEAQNVQKTQSGIHVIVMNSDFRSSLARKGIVAPVHDAMLESLRDLSKGAGTSPLWLREGLSYKAGYLILDRMKTGLLEPGVWAEDVASTLRDGEAPGLQDVISGKVRDPEVNGFDTVSAFLVSVLEEQSSMDFQKAWVAYFRNLGVTPNSSDEAFEGAFGLSIESFARLAESRLSELKNQKLQHADLDVANARLAAAKGITPMELPGQKLKDAFERYLKRPAPKAFSFSGRGGYWTYDTSDPRAMEKSLRRCREAEPLGCKLYAIDDTVVLSASQEPGAIDVQMFGKHDSGWSSTVQQAWLPVIRDSSERFNHAIRDKLGVTLKEDTRIYVVADRADYRRVLNEEIQQSNRSAELTASSSDGFANATGKLVTAIFSEYSDDYRWALSTTVTLHELTHELQAQLSQQYAGFRAPRWMTEGTADQIAYLVGKDIPIPAGTKYEIDDWREKCTEWYKLGGVRTTRPADVLNPDFGQWLQLIKDGKQPYQMSGLMVMHLQDLLGDRYYPSLIGYFRLAGTKDRNEPEAFEQSFGISQKEFSISLNKWLVSLVATN